MPRPTSGTTLQRADLGMLAYEYMTEASRRGFIAQELLPIFPVAEQSADYPVIPIESLLKMPDTKRSARGNYNRSDYSFETGTYSCDEHGWEEVVDRVERNLYSRFFDSSVVAVERAVDVLMRGYEKRVADYLFNTANITNTSNVATEWSTITATPRANVIAAKQAMRAASGLMPDTIAMSQKVWENLLKVTEIINAFTYTSPIEVGNVEAQKRIIAQYFGVEKIVVGNAIYDSAKKGQTFSISDVWDDEYILLAKVLSGNNLRQPVLGATFLWEQDSPDILTTEEYEEPQTASTIYRVRHHTDEKLIFSGAGYLLGNITA